MLLAVFRSHEERYAIGVGSIVEVIPLVKLYSMPNTPDYFAGIFDYRGEPTPVLDLSMLTSGQPSRNSISTRIKDSDMVALAEYLAGMRPVK